MATKFANFTFYRYGLGLFCLNLPSNVGFDAKYVLLEFNVMMTHVNENHVFGVITIFLWHFFTHVCTE